MLYRLPRAVLADTFEEFRRCGRGRRECMAFWTGPWAKPEAITRLVHAGHSAHVGGVEVDQGWLAALWKALADASFGVKVQVHTHPGAAFHSATDDDFPVVHTAGFLSLVIPRFALGEIGFEGAYLAELDKTGRWREVAVQDRLELI